MNLDNHFWYFQSALSKKFCDQLVEYALSLKDQIGLTGNITSKPRKKNQKNKLSKKDLLDLRKKRDSNVVWLDERWIYNEVQPYIHTANKNAGWNFEFDFTESCQFTKYHKGQFYGWHTDSWAFPYNKDKSNLIRKCPEVKPKGSIVVFPSFVWHRVKPVTKGTRYSLVCWNLGYPFR